MSYFAEDDDKKPSSDFRSQLWAMVDRLITIGQKGVNVNEDRKGASELIVRSNRSMSTDVFELGCAIAAKFPTLSYRAWGHWMTDARVEDRGGKVFVFHRSLFFCSHAEKEVGAFIREHIGKPVAFLPDRSIARRVEA